LAILRDITAEKRAAAERSALEAQMREAQKLETLGLLAGGIAHDFNNLLAAVMANVGLCQRYLADGRDVRPLLAETTRASERAAALCSQMLTYAGKAKLEVGPVDLNALIREMAELMKAAISKRARISTTLAPALQPVRGDAVQLQQVLMNLIMNASDALGETSGDIAIETGACHIDGVEAAFLRVNDDGCGMSEAIRARMFDPFFTTKATGRGLGLAATLGVVRSLHGKVHVDSEPGRGTCVRVDLPTTTPAEKVAPDRPAPSRSAPSRQHGHGTVLVADDEAAVRRVIAEILRDAGFTVVEAADGVLAVEAGRKHGQALTALVLDLTMPGLGGIEALRTLRHEALLAPAILTTGYAPTMRDELAKSDLAPVRVLGKPFLAEELLSAVFNAVGVHVMKVP
jgi:CheY-like chemotaxis protein/two-component sensor histidine kinase